MKRTQDSRLVHTDVGGKGKQTGVSRHDGNGALEKCQPRVY